MIIDTVEALTKLIMELKKEGNLLYPLAFCDSIAPMHRVSVRRVIIDPNPDHGEVYHPKQVSANKFALTKIALLKIDLAAGLDWVSALCYRTDDGRDQFYCKYKVCAKIQDLDGSYRELSTEYTLDYRDGSIAIDGLSVNDVRQRRMSIVQRAETAAKNRLRRDAVGVKPVYSVDELKKPFIVIKLVKNIPSRYNDAVAASLIGVDKAIFGNETQVITSQETEPPEANKTVQEEITDENKPISKDELVKSIENLYIQKLGQPRPGSRKPLSELSMEQLEDVMKKLMEMENIK